MGSRKNVVVIGGGVGGLVAAIDLARQGVPVQLLERQPDVGGKMRRVAVGSDLIDAGPTVLTMRWVFDELCDDAGVSLDEVAQLKRTDCLGRHVWDDGSQLDLYSDIERSGTAISALCGADAAEGYRRFCAYAEAIYRCVDEPVMRVEQPTLLGLMRSAGLKGLPQLRAIDPGRVMWRALGEFFADPRLRQLFARYATYCGSSPFAAPATLNLVAHVERIGVHLVEGGMYQLAAGLAALAQRLGVTIRCDAPVERIVLSGGRASAVELASGERLEARAIVANADVSTVAQMLGGSGRRLATRPAQRSLSALTWAVVARTEGIDLLRHNVFFRRSDYADEFRDIFKARKLPNSPTVYLCAQDRDELGALPAERRDGSERMLVLVNAPATADQTSALKSEEIEQCEQETFDFLQRCGLTIERSDADPVRSGPTDFERLCPGTGGAIYGPVSHGWRSTFRRAWTRSGPEGLYLASGSIHPGAGVPMAALSGRTAARALRRDLDSTSRSHQVATAGGISTV
jgi:1-hydroxycarotenoid 3,4-desaturase